MSGAALSPPGPPGPTPGGRPPSAGDGPAHRDALRLAAGPYVRRPPGRRHVLVPLSSAGAAAAGLQLGTGSRRSTAFLQVLERAAVRLGGPAALRGARVGWVPPMPVADWADLLGALRARVGGIDALAVYTQPQRARAGLALLALSGGRAVAFVKLRTQRPALAHEHAVLEQGATRGSRTFRLPTPLGLGSQADWHWLAMEPLPSGPGWSGTLRTPGPGVHADIRALVAGAVARPAGTPSHWEPAHGDLTPWNLRRDRADLWIMDWEAACWAPPGYDDVYFRAVTAVLRGSRPDPAPAGHREAVHAWIERMTARFAQADDQILTLELASALEQMLT